MQEIRFDPIDACIVRVQPRVVMDIEAGEYAAHTHHVDEFLHHRQLGGMRLLAARSHPVVVRLAVKAAQPGTSRPDVSDEVRQCTRELGASVFSHNGLRRQPTGVLVAVQQYRDE